MTLNDEEINQSKLVFLTLNLSLFTFNFLSDVMYEDGCKDLFYYYGTQT